MLDQNLKNFLVTDLGPVHTRAGPYGSVLFGPDPEFFPRAHGIGAKKIRVNTGADPSGFN